MWYKNYLPYATLQGETFLLHKYAEFPMFKFYLLL